MSTTNAFCLHHQLLFQEHALIILSTRHIRRNCTNDRHCLRTILHTIYQEGQTEGQDYDQHYSVLPPPPPAPGLRCMLLFRRLVQQKTNRFYHTHTILHTSRQGSKATTTTNTATTLRPRHRQRASAALPFRSAASDGNAPRTFAMDIASSTLPTKAARQQDRDYEQHRNSFAPPPAIESLHCIPSSPCAVQRQ